MAIDGEDMSGGGEGVIEEYFPEPPPPPQAANSMLAANMPMAHPVAMERFSRMTELEQMRPHKQASPR
jgi:hypothetical protein